MNSKKLFTAILFVLAVSVSFAQEYFQQRTDYKIKVKLNDKNNTLSAYLELKYTNNSPDNLDIIWMHLWPNAYKNNTTELAKELASNKKFVDTFSNYSETGFIDSLNFKADSKNVKWEYHPNHIDVCKLTLNEPLEPGKSITITTPFFVKIPNSRFSRLGTTKNTYQITQWYPKPAVYDSKGWHYMPYRNMGEFYSEFGSFDVSISIPSDYVVGATGILQTKSEIDFLNRRAEETKKLIKKDRNIAFNFPSDKNSEYKTIRYTEDNIHDFAWFADKNYGVLKGKVKLNRGGKEVTTWSMFTDYKIRNWKNSIEYINDALTYYSDWYGDYPYNNCTAVEGALSAGGGMEYPTITIIGNASSPFANEQVIMHEVGHNWFYGMLAFNERDYPYLDEGLNTFSDMRYVEKKLPDNKLFDMLFSHERYLPVGKFMGIDKLKYKDLHRYQYLYAANKGIDQKINSHSAEFSQFNYGAIPYSKAGLSFALLKDYMGEETFDKAMQSFFNKWKFKHPQPKDFETSIKQHTDKNLDWFFDDVINTTKKIDYKISGLRKNNLKIRNIGQINSPIQVKTLLNDKETYSTWIEGFKNSTKIKIPDNINYDKVILNGEYLDIRKKNNFIRKNGIFRTYRPVNFKFLGAVEHKTQNRINYIPTYGYNTTNKSMLGLTFYNNYVPRDNMLYRISPLYAFGNKEFAGSADIRYTWRTESSLLKNISLDMNFKRFGYEECDPSSLIFRADGKFQYSEKSYFKSSGKISLKLQSESFNTINVKHTYSTNLIFSTNIHSNQYLLKDGFNNITDITYLHKSKINYSPFSFKANLEYHKDFTKAFIESEYKYNIYKKYNVWLRIFAGKMFNNSTKSNIYNFTLNGTGKFNDYKFENDFFDRTSSIHNESNYQMADDMGMFTFQDPLMLFSTDEWMVATNIKFNLPFLRFLRGYINIGMTEGSEYYNVKRDDIAYEAGIELPIAKRTLVVYFPLLYSSELENHVDSYADDYIDRIRFSFNLNKTLNFLYDNL